MKSCKIKTALFMVAFPLTNALATQPVNKVWTGAYGGVEGGFIFNQPHVSSEQLGFTSESGTCNGGENFSSFLLGAQLGYAKQMQNNVVLGVEGNVTYNVNQSKYYKCQCPFNGDVSDNFIFKNRRQASLTGRLGYALQISQQSLLPFVMAGVSAGDLGLSYKNEGGDSYSQNSIQSGWLAGAGLEWAFLQHWSVRAEYFHIDYGNRAVSLNIPVVYGLMDTNGHANMSLSSNNIVIALNYWI